MNQKILMATGASGGHVFPALATAEALRTFGIETVFVLGGGKFNQAIVDAGFATEQLPASAWVGKGPLAKVNTILTVIKAWFKARQLVQKHNPIAAVGTGGYGSVALVLAAKALNVPTMIHEQNATPGRANKFLSTYADKIALAFKPAAQHFGSAAQKTVVTGNPLRQAVLSAATTEEPAEPPFNILILGGSLGAQFLSDIIPAALGELSEGQLIKLSITHQARPENLADVRQAYKQLGVQAATVESFFDDIPQRLASAHLVISRAGASAITEYALYGRASILVPHRLADHHQLANAKVLSDIGGAILLQQQDCTPQTLSSHIEEMLSNPTKRHEIAKQAHSIAQPKAAENVARAIVALAAGSA